VIFRVFLTDTYTILYQWSNSELSESTEANINRKKYSPGAGARGGPARCKIWYYFVSKDGKFIESNLVNYLGNRHNAKDTCKKYNVGDVVETFYDPNNPNFSVLELTGIGERIYEDFIIIFVFTFGALIWSLVAIKNRKS